jgi:hypothetical protein
MAALPTTSFTSLSPSFLFSTLFSFLHSSTAAASDDGGEDATLAPDSSFPPSFPILSSVPSLADSVVIAAAAAAGVDIVIGCVHLKGDEEEDEGDDDDEEEPTKPE